MATVTDYTALLTGSYWGGIEVVNKPVFVTYSFDASAPASDKTNLAASAYATFTPFTAAQQAEATTALAEYSANSGIIFEQVAAGQGDINFASYNFSTDPNYKYAGGVGFYPWGNWNNATYPYFSADLPGSGNILMNTAYVTGGLFTYETLLHEIGHAVGLKHPDQAWTDYGTPTPTVHNTWNPNVPLGPTVMYEGASTLTHLGSLDIQAIQAIYGKNGQISTIDASWSWDTSTYTLTQHLVDAATVETRGVSTSNVIYAGKGNDTIYAMGSVRNIVIAGVGKADVIGGTGTTYVYAGTGAVTFDGTFGPLVAVFANQPSAVTVNLLNPAQNTGQAKLDTFVAVHRLIGSNYGDMLIADNAGDTITGGSGNDTITGGTKRDVLNGGAGNDTIYGAGGGDSLSGGLGADTFQFKFLSDSTVAAAGRATISDFSTAQGDKIDLRQLETNLHETFSFIGLAAFGGQPGQIEQTAVGANTMISIDTNGDRIADFSVLLNGAHTLAKSDFLL